MSDTDDREQSRRRYESLLNVLGYHSGRMRARTARRVAGRSGYSHSADEMRRTQRAAIEQGDVVRYSRRGTEFLVLAEPEPLKAVQREAGERGDSETVGAIQRALHRVEGADD